MNPEQLDVLRLALPAITTDKVREALLEFLMTGARPTIKEVNAMMPGIDKLCERYVVHFLSPSSLNGDSVLRAEECIREIRNSMPKTNDEPRTH